MSFYLSGAWLGLAHTNTYWCYVLKKTLPREVAEKTSEYGDHRSDPNNQHNTRSWTEKPCRQLLIIVWITGLITLRRIAGDWRTSPSGSRGTMKKTASVQTMPWEQSRREGSPGANTERHRGAGIPEDLRSRRELRERTEVVSCAELRRRHRKMTRKI